MNTIGISTRERPTTTCLISWEPCAMEDCSLLKLAEQAKRARDQLSQKLRRRVAWHNSKGECTGLAQTTISPFVATTICCTCTPGVNTFVPTTTSLRLF